MTRILIIICAFAITGNFNTQNAKAEVEIAEVTGNAATTKFKYFKRVSQTCTDFMYLYKFEEGWRIVSTITYHHQD